MELDLLIADALEVVAQHQDRLAAHLLLLGNIVVLL